MNRSGELWTGVDDDELRRLFDARTPPARTARLLGRSQSAVSSRKVLLRLKRD